MRVTSVHAEIADMYELYLMKEKKTISCSWFSEDFCEFQGINGDSALLYIQRGNQTFIEQIPSVLSRKKVSRHIFDFFFFLKRVFD